jgi:NAD(P)-dependent dehydrogenase (short-subunit alcohol dehydrogenase family)
MTEESGTGPHGRIAVVTGAAGGIGGATARHFALAGWKVYATDRRVVGGWPDGVLFHQVDVTDAGGIERFFAWLSQVEGKLDALVNNAAIQICKPLVEMTPEEWDQVMAANLRSVFLTAKYGYPLLKAAEGAIVNVSSVHALATSRDIAAYAASKGGLLALTRAMALEFAPAGVRVNAILPGAVDTQMLREGLSRGHVEGGSIEQRLEDLANKTVMGRVGKPQEIAEAILFLADSRRSSFMTGQALVVDGGATARLSTE